MSASVVPSWRQRRLHALGVTPLRLRTDDVPAQESHARSVEPPPTALPCGIRRLALLPDPRELHDAAINAMYTALTEAVVKAGLQSVRVVDVLVDPTAAVLVFGEARAPEHVPVERVLRADALAILHVDRARKRALWDMLCALGRGAGAR